MTVQLPRISALCFTACPRTGVMQSSDDTLQLRTGDFLHKVVGSMLPVCAL